MPRRKRDDAPRTIQHVIQRGNNRNYIYEDIRDKREFFSILSTALSNHDAVLLQYVLMDNHYHLLIKLGEKSLSDLIWFLNRNYSLYYNQRYNRVGTIYGGRYKSYILIESQKFFSTVRYIVQNPLKAGLVSTPAEYRWSGHASIIGNAPTLINRTALLSYFSPDAKMALKRYVECTEHESWTPQVGFATIIDPKTETEERLGFLLDRFLSEQNQGEQKKLVLSGASTSLSRELRGTFIKLAIADGHALKDVASFLYVSHETVRRIGKQKTS